MPSGVLAATGDEAQATKKEREEYTTELPPLASWHRRIRNGFMLQNPVSSKAAGAGRDGFAAPLAVGQRPSARCLSKAAAAASRTSTEIMYPRVTAGGAFGVIGCGLSSERQSLFDFRSVVVTCGLPEMDSYFGGVGLLSFGEELVCNLRMVTCV